ncbi:MAG TPA: AraC family transcriptional regulator [Polyangiaceae bacterium]|nr:AraC family transcriptional regulator [Polyangiaceae bacterium]
MPNLPEPTLSIRLIWPFARILGEDYFRAPELLGATGLTIEQFGEPDTRVPHSVAMRALDSAVAKTGDPTLGLRAGAAVDQSELEVLEYAARTKRTLGEALELMIRYGNLMNEAIEFSIAEEGDNMLFLSVPIRGATMPPAGNDYIVACAIAFSKRNAETYVPPVEVRLMHPPPSYRDAYERFFETKVVFGAPENAVVQQKSRLATPMKGANPIASRAFELQAAKAMERLRIREGNAGRVREAIARSLADGPPSMRAAARELAMGVATLRRRLDAEGTTFSDLVDEVRRALAERHLASSETTISEVAFLLGFSDVRAFGRAFRRWYGMLPSEWRKAKRSSGA